MGWKKNGETWGGKNSEHTEPAPVKPRFLWRVLTSFYYPDYSKFGSTEVTRKEGGVLPAVIKQGLRERLCALQLFRLRLKDVFQFFPSFSGCFSVSFSSKQRDQENKISWVPCFGDAWRGMRGVTERAAQLY